MQYTQAKQLVLKNGKKGILYKHDENLTPIQQIIRVDFTGLVLATIGTGTSFLLENSNTGIYVYFSEGQNGGDPKSLQSGTPIRVEPALDTPASMATELASEINATTSTLGYVAIVDPASTSKVIITSSRKRNLNMPADVDSGVGIELIQEGVEDKKVLYGGNLNWRLNNPGSIKNNNNFATAMGAIGHINNLAVFPDYDTGREVLKNLIFQFNGDSSIRGLFHKHNYFGGITSQQKLDEMMVYLQSQFLTSNLETITVTELLAINPPYEKTLLDAIEDMIGFTEGTTEYLAGRNIKDL